MKNWKNDANFMVSLVQLKPKLVVCSRWGNSKLFYLLLYALISGIFEYCTWISICLSSIFHCNHFCLFNFWFVCLLLRLQNVFLSTWQCNANLFSNQMCVSTCITIECNIIIHNTLKWRGNLKWFQNHWLKNRKTTQKKLYSCQRIPFRLTFSICLCLCACNGFKGNVFHCYCVITFWKVILYAIKMDNKLSHLVMQESSTVSRGLVFVFSNSSFNNNIKWWSKMNEKNFNRK